MNKIGLFFIVFLFIQGCAKPYVVETKSVRDEKLSCGEIERKLDEIEDYRQKAIREKGITPENVASAVFFLPGLLATYSNVEDAVQAAEKRKQNLNDIYYEKKCTDKKMYN